jgi:hypothetical protein
MSPNDFTNVLVAIEVKLPANAASRRVVDDGGSTADWVDQHALCPVTVIR